MKLSNRPTALLALISVSIFCACLNGQSSRANEQDSLKAYERSQKQLQKEREKQAKNSQRRGNKGSQGKDWNKSEYSGRHSAKDIEMALYSKGFTWLSGSPADNEKLSIGKNAQFFGFVALRYQSGRIAKRGELGRAFHQLASPEQRAIITEAVQAEEESLATWWTTRSQILRELEHHLYTGDDFNHERMSSLARAFGWLNAEVALHEAKAFAAVEDLLTKDQWTQLRAWRANPALAATGEKRPRHFQIEDLSPDLEAQYEDLFAKAFTWLTGKMDDNQVMPLGQPAQFFGFVSIRHKSGHGASRGKISKQFQQLLNPKQRSAINDATKDLVPIVSAFKAKRSELLLEMSKLREAPDSFSRERYRAIAHELGLLEIAAGMAEAKAYQRIRGSMSPKQDQAMMKLRSEYVLDSKAMENLDTLERGKILYNLCQSCHANPQVAPRLQGILNSPIANLRSYDYSEALKRIAKKKSHWNADTLDEFLANPSRFAPGNKMGFQGLLNKADRDALIQYLDTL